MVFPMKYDVFAVHVPLNQSIDTINQNHHVLKLNFSSLLWVKQS